MIYLKYIQNHFPLEMMEYVIILHMIMMYYMEMD